MRRVHSQAFKLEVVGQLFSGEKRPAQVCREYGLAESLVQRWRREYAERGEEAFAPRAYSREECRERRVAEFERLCGQLALENTVLKKALGKLPLRRAMR
jgi:transposase